jgi:hypothetical protein
MSRTLRNTVTVLIVTLFTGIAVFATVQLAARVAGPAGAGTQAAQAAEPSQQGIDEGSSLEYGDGYGDGSGTYPQDEGAYGYGNGYGYGSGSGSAEDQGSTAQDSGSGTLTCPSTGCTASTCHATQ